MWAKHQVTKDLGQEAYGDEVTRRSKKVGGHSCEKNQEGLNSCLGVKDYNSLHNSVGKCWSDIVHMKKITQGLPFQNIFNISGPKVLLTVGKKMLSRDQNLGQKVIEGRGAGTGAQEKG